MTNYFSRKVRVRNSSTHLAFCKMHFFTHMTPLKKIIICHDKHKLYDKMNKLFMFMSEINDGQIKQIN